VDGVRLSSHIAAGRRTCAGGGPAATGCFLTVSPASARVPWGAGSLRVAHVDARCLGAAVRSVRRDLDVDVRHGRHPVLNVVVAEPASLLYAKHQPLVLGDCYPVDRVEVRRQTRDARRGDPEKKV
jgi:hypothetical protein